MYRMFTRKRRPDELLPVAFLGAIRDFEKVVGSLPHVACGRGGQPRGSKGALLPLLNTQRSGKVARASGGFFSSISRHPRAHVLEENERAALQ
jgi:hypothetical protein